MDHACRSTVWDCICVGVRENHRVSLSDSHAVSYCDGHRWPEQFQTLIDLLGILKGDIINFLNLKCFIPMNLYVQVYMVSAIIPGFVVCAIYQTWWQRGGSVGSDCKCGRLQSTDRAIRSHRLLQTQDCLRLWTLGRSVSMSLGPRISLP